MYFYNVLSEKFSGVMSSPAEGDLGEHMGVCMGKSILSTVCVSRGTLRAIDTVGVSGGRFRSSNIVFINASSGRGDE